MNLKFLAIMAKRKQETRESDKLENLYCFYFTLYADIGFL